MNHALTGIAKIQGRFAPARPAKKSTPDIRFKCIAFPKYLLGINTIQQIKAL